MSTSRVTGVHCPICRLRHQYDEDDYYADDDDSGGTNQDTGWSPKVRALCAGDSIDDIYISGPGYFSVGFDVFACDARGNCGCSRLQCHHNEAVIYSIWPPPFFPPPIIGPARISSGEHDPYTWYFVVHHVCWELLLTRLAGRFSPQSLSTRLFALLYSVRQSIITKSPDYEYVSTARFLRKPQTALSDLDDIHDPTKPFDLYDQRLETACGVPLPSPTPILAKTNMENGDNYDIFGNLPNEIIMLILASLPSRGVCNLRLASRHVCCHSSPHLLSQEFWASRFSPEGECGFVFANEYCSRPSGFIDWRRLYFRAALACELSPNFRTRRRLWSVLGHWAHHLRLSLADKNVVLDAS